MPKMENLHTPIVYKMKQKCESKRMRMIWKMLIPIPFIPRVFIINVQVP